MKVLGSLREVAKKKAVASPSTGAMPDVWDGFYEKLRNVESAEAPPALLDSDQEYWRRTFVRNQPGGSSAYGPVQITATLFQDMHEKPEKYGLSPEDKANLPFFLDQGKEFLKQGNVPGADPTYDYSGRGHLDKLDPKEQVRKKAAYKSLAKKAIREHFIRAGGTEQDMVRLWRGKEPHEDPKYFQKYFGAGK